MKIESGLVEPVRPLHWRLKITFWLDVLLALSICSLQTVSATGLVIHEWLGLTVVGMVFAHLLFSWSWISSTSRRLLSQSTRAHINYIINVALFCSVIATIFSGVIISQKAVPVLTGSKAVLIMNWPWDRLHNDFAGAVLMLSGFHIAINWEWIVAASQKILRRIFEASQ
jgi:hypothetical protein